MKKWVCLALPFGLASSFLGALPAIAEAGAQPPTCALSANFDQRLGALLPTVEEDAFLRIPWRLNVMAARLESLRTGKPMLVWEMDGNPLGHT